MPFDKFMHSHENNLLPYVLSCISNLFRELITTSPDMQL